MIPDRAFSFQLARRRIAALIIVGGLAAGTSLPAGAQSIAVEPPTRISPPGTGNHWFTNVSADPEDPQRVLACGIRTLSAANRWQGFVYLSEDGGRTWRLAFADSSGQLVSEETCEFGPDGHAYFVAQTWNDMYEHPRLGYGTLRLYQSLDHGRAWTPTIIDPSRTAWFDYARIGVDLTGGSRRGTVYIFAGDGVRSSAPDSGHHPVTPMFVLNDAGRLPGPRIELPLRQPVSGGYPEAVRVLLDGTVLAAYSNRYPQRGTVAEEFAAIDKAMTDTAKPYVMQPFVQLVQIVRSTNGGKTLEEPITVGPTWGLSPALAVDASQGPRRGRVYLAWSDTTAGRVAIYLATSDDDGRTWTPRRMVEGPGRTGHGQLERDTLTDPSLAVNRDGVVGLAWSSHDGLCWHFAASTDGGQAFRPTVPLNQCPRDGEPGLQSYDNRLSAIPLIEVPDTTHATYLNRTGLTVRIDHTGGAKGLTATSDGVFHPIWSIRGTDGRLWTTRVTVRPTTEPPPPPVLTGLIDVSSRVTFDIVNETYDAGTSTVSIDVRVVNKDTTAIRAPLRVQVKELGSSFGAVDVVDADNGATGQGAIWDFTDLVPDRVLASWGSRSRTRQLVFHVRNVKPGVDMAALVTAELRVYAGSS